MRTSKCTLDWTSTLHVLLTEFGTIQNEFETSRFALKETKRTRNRQSTHSTDVLLERKVRAQRYVVARKHRVWQTAVLALLRGQRRQGHHRHRAHAATLRADIEMNHTTRRYATGLERTAYSVYNTFLMNSKLPLVLSARSEPCLFVSLQTHSRYHVMIAYYLCHDCDHLTSDSV
jgi:hypothetical protein